METTNQSSTENEDQTEVVNEENIDTLKKHKDNTKNPIAQ